MMSLDQCCARMAAATGASPAEVLNTVTAVPARVIGATDRGALDVGLVADIVVLNEAYDLQLVVRRGHIVVNKFDSDRVVTTRKK